MTALLAILGLTVACALWVLVQRQADRVLPGNPGVVRDCKGCPQPAETCAPTGGNVAVAPSREQTSCSPTASARVGESTANSREIVGAGLDPARVGGPTATIPSEGIVGAELVSARVGESTASTTSRGPSSCPPTASPPECVGVAASHRHPSRGET
jgi:hypothetical protein